MADKDGELAARIVGGVAALAAGYAARKVITFAWTRAVGKEPPSDPESPDIGLGEALGWAVVTGVGMEVARVLAVRAAHKRLAPRRHRKIEDLPV
ncbi:DUF4235 domain-containing protein [Marinitenerispora sediminis]|uniref:DUF4235 domain-containing protein n=1 Tax=Marinitenerispora sediminis TaxID=1931232 RepID=A0A368T758_9ACTN|nr:DUF4235 domain-containing protein [Marinitenerispora sediminis]RCV49484.1 hypothetical protein DEF28_20725 [Marinitenerispora sediminis]RCV57017.1 hypothetical protein DEF24_15785 [Marinitenerispora sediminis]RCV58654.1 hypothetical protein DEF23_08485 [Marinitenerispora sediminis]